MPLDGTLKDLSLPSLVQLQCSERRRVHVRLARAGRSGELVFADGELIHARVASLAEGPGSASLTGDQAVFDLLSWDDGEFHVSDSLGALPPRSVNTPANALLLEGLRLLDEKRAQRNAALEQSLHQLKAKQALRRALVVSPSGMLHADVTDGTATQDAELIFLVTGLAQAIGATLNCGPFQQLVCSLPSDHDHLAEKTFIEKFDEAYLAAWVDARASPDLLKTLLHSLMHAPDPTPPRPAGSPT